MGHQMRHEPKLLSFSAKVYASPASPTFLFKVIDILFIKKVGDASDALNYLFLAIFLEIKLVTLLVTHLKISVPHTFNLHISLYIYIYIYIYMYNLQENLQISIWFCHLFQSTSTSVSSAPTGPG